MWGVPNVSRSMVTKLSGFLTSELADAIEMIVFAENVIDAKQANVRPQMLLVFMITHPITIFCRSLEGDLLQNSKI